MANGTIWHFTYDETASTVLVYFDGAEVPTPASAFRKFCGGTWSYAKLKNATQFSCGWLE